MLGHTCKLYSYKVIHNYFGEIDQEIARNGQKLSQGGRRKGDGEGEGDEEGGRGRGRGGRRLFQVFFNY